MRKVHLLVLALLAVTVLTGCGGDRDIEVNVYVGSTPTAAPGAEATRPPAIPSPTAAVGKPASAPGAEPTATTLEPAVAEPTQAPEEPSAPPPTEAPSEAAPAPTAPPPSPPTKAPQVPEEVYTSAPAAWEASVTTLSSFRQKVSLDFTADGTGVHSKAVYVGEVTTRPTALHSTLTVEGQAAAELPSNQVEVIWIGEEAWVKIGRRPWVPVPVTALETSMPARWWASAICCPTFPRPIA